MAPTTTPTAPAPQAPSPKRGAPSTPSGPSAGSSHQVDDWSHWWRLNQHEYLQLKDAVWRGGPVTGGASFALGAGQESVPNSLLRPSDRQLTELVAPALKRALKVEGQPQVLSGLLMALAKLGELPVQGDAATSGETLLAFVAHSSQEVSETAALALGVLGERTWLDELSNLCADSPAGRDLVGRGNVNERTRAFAAYGLGMLAQRSDSVDVQRYVAHSLVQRLEAGERGAYDLPVACLNALSLVDLPTASDELGSAIVTSSREALIAYLLELLEERRFPDLAKAQIPRVLARLLDPFEDPLKELVAEELMSLAKNGQKTQREIQYGAIQALGLIGTAGSRPIDLRIRRTLDDVYLNGDLLARNVSLISMAKLGARPHPGSPDPVAGLESTRKSLATAFARGKSRTRPWAALALGVHGFHARAAGLELSADVSLALQRELDETRSAADAGAVALAVGLRGQTGAVDLMLERVDDFRVDATRGQFALALGLLGEARAGTRLTGLLEESSWRPQLFRSVAIGLAMIGDKQLVPRLSETMAGAKSSAVIAVNAWALAWAGDARAIGPLVALLDDPATSTPTREVSAVAVGWVCERERMPWYALLSSDANHFIAPPTLTAPAGGGVLDIR